MYAVSRWSWNASENLHISPKNVLATGKSWVTTDSVALSEASTPSMKATPKMCKLLKTLFLVSLLLVNSSIVNRHCCSTEAVNDSLSHRQRLVFWGMIFSGWYFSRNFNLNSDLWPSFPALKLIYFTDDKSKFQHTNDAQLFIFDFKRFRVNVVRNVENISDAIWVKFVIAKFTSAVITQPQKIKLEVQTFEVELKFRKHLLGLRSEIKLEDNHELFGKYLNT